MLGKGKQDLGDHVEAFRRDFVYAEKTLGTATEGVYFDQRERCFFKPSEYISTLE